jgi:hypothetical protein
MDILKNINPLCLALSPYAVIARAIHQIPIVLKNKPTALTYNKYAGDVLPADVSFATDIWQSFQFVEHRFNDNWVGPDILEHRINNWSMVNFGIPSNCIRWDGTPKAYIEMITRKRPSEVIRNHTHLIVIGEQITFGFLDHFYCDGNTLIDYFRNIFVDESLIFPAFPKYTYYPFISDAMSIKLLSEQCIEMLKYPTQIRGISDKTRVLSKCYNKNEELVWNRWTTFAVSTLPIFDSLPNVDYLHVLLTVGFDTDRTFGNNRIGGIPVRIIRPKKSTYKQEIADLMEQYKIRVTNNYTDAHTSYDLLRGYNNTYLRSSGIYKSIDIMFTNIHFKKEIQRLRSGVGGFVGGYTTNEFLYINTISHGILQNITYVSNLKQLNYDTLVNDGMTIDYEFDNNDPEQF